MTTAPTQHVTDDSQYKLGTELITKIEKIASDYPDKNSAMLPALHLIQDKFGWVPAAAVKQLANLLDATPNKIYAVLTFYTMFNTKPVGRYHIQACRNVSCSLLGSKKIHEHISEKYGLQPGRTTSDGKFTLRQVECLGSCGTAPVMMINDTYYDRLTEKKVDEILESLQ